MSQKYIFQKEILSLEIKDLFVRFVKKSVRTFNYKKIQLTYTHK